MANTEVENKVELPSADICRKSNILNIVLSKKGIAGIDVNLSNDKATVVYDNTYFRHQTIAGVPVVLPKKSHRYGEVVEALSKIECGLVGERVAVPFFTSISDDAELLNQVMGITFDRAIWIGDGLDPIKYNSAYFTVDTGVIDVRPKIKKLMERV